MEAAAASADPVMGIRLMLGMKLCHLGVSVLNGNLLQRFAILFEKLEHIKMQLKQAHRSMAKNLSASAAAVIFKSATQVRIQVTADVR
jgi:hypothetical protein